MADGKKHTRTTDDFTMNMSLFSKDGGKHSDFSISLIERARNAGLEDFALFSAEHRRVAEDVALQQRLMTAQFFGDDKVIFRMLRTEAGLFFRPTAEQQASVAAEDQSVRLSQRSGRGESVRAGSFGVGEANQRFNRTSSRRRRSVFDDRTASPAGGLGAGVGRNLLGAPGGGL